MKNIRLVITVCAVAIASFVSAQANLDSIKTELYKVNRVFDSSSYLGFNVNIQYTSDTLYGRFEHEEMSGKYVLNNRNLYYKMGNIEFAQNDSFAYSIYHDERMMMMTKDIMASNSLLFPLKEFVDSVITLYDSLYTISMYTVDESQVIAFTAISNNVPYKRFAIYFEPESHYPDKFEMTMIGSLDNLYDIPDSIAQLIRVRPVEKRITMTFSNYYHPKTLEMFDNTSYVFFDRQRKKYKPAEKFKAYRFITNGVEGEEYDDSLELSTPPPDDDQ